MSAPSLLPPVTIEHVYGFVGDKHEPHLVNHLNTGICAEDAEAYKVKALPYPDSVGRTYGTSSTLSIVGGITSLVATGVVYLIPGIEAAIFGLGLAVTGLGLVFTAVGLGIRAATQRRRYDASQEAFTTALNTILRTQGDLIPLPLAGFNGHTAEVDDWVTALEDGRGHLLAATGDRHELIAGGEKLFTALHHLGAYAQAPSDDQTKKAKAADTIADFLAYVTRIAREHAGARA